ncbi:hypothetical protein [Kroppenstedtia guangzhouensis]|uniref:hypothetical protein n=1 Tax=Kroppenstedtia guangzhouensis TaxID=1274356 RepID=UPI00166A71C5|nr:hypothetical protein [Kroppenstedtia guangzhouensis]
MPGKEAALRSCLFCFLYFFASWDHPMLSTMGMKASVREGKEHEPQENETVRNVTVTTVGTSRQPRIFAERLQQGRKRCELWWPGWPNMTFSLFLTAKITPCETQPSL